MSPSPPLRRTLAVALAALVGLLLLGAAPAPEPDGEPVPGVDVAAVPEAAREWLPLIGDLTATGCPELPPVWVVAQVQVESGWDASLVAGGPGGPAGLYQFGADSWRAAGGDAWSADPPVAGDDVLDVEAHLRVAVPWICTNLRAVARHLTDTGKSADPLDAMLVCHLAGCARVAGSATGVPVAGEASCGARCAEVIRSYVDAVHAEVARFSGEPAGPPPEEPAATPDPMVPAPWTGGDTGCELTDPTGDGCLTGAARHGLEAARPRSAAGRTAR